MRKVYCLDNTRSSRGAFAESCANLVSVNVEFRIVVGRAVGATRREGRECGVERSQSVRTVAEAIIVCESILSHMLEKQLPIVLSVPTTANCQTR